jgi:capsular polysaccharide biosynthesis protein
VIPLKLVETIFHRYWALVLPVVIVPLVALALTTKSSQYQSYAVVWASSPVASEKPALGAMNPYLTQAQNQAQAVNDLLSTLSFRTQVSVDAGVVPPTADDATLRRAANEVKAWAYPNGANLITITATAPSNQNAQAIVSAIIDQYLARATASIESGSAVSIEYYNQQVAIAQQAFDMASSELAAYLRSNPKAIDVTNIASQDVTYRTLREQVDSQSRLVSSLQEAIQAVQLRAASAPQTQESMFAVQDPASLPLAPTPVSMTSKYGPPAAGIILGLFIGFAYLYVAYRTDHTIRSAEDLSGISIPLLGSVPQLQAAPLWARYTPVSWVIRWRRKDFARKTATSISIGFPAAPNPTPEVS